MKTDNYSILKIYASTTDKIGTELLYEHIVHLAKGNGLSGVTVYRGIMGYGASSKHISSSRFWELTEKLPVVIEIIDQTLTINKFYDVIKPLLENMPKGCLVMIEPVEILLSKAGTKP